MLMFIVSWLIVLVLWWMLRLRMFVWIVLVIVIVLFELMFGSIMMNFLLL